MNPDVDRLLAGNEYFRGLSDAHRGALASACLCRSFRKRETLFLEGEKGASIFLLASGAVQLNKSTPDGREIVIRTVQPGEVFAEVVLFEQETYPVSATAVCRSVAVQLPRSAVLGMLRHEAFRNDFIGGLMKRLRYLAERILHLAAYDVEARFFEFLRQHYGSGDSYTVTLRKKDLAAAIGTTPETLSRLLRRLRKDGRIRWKGRSLTLAERPRGAGHSERARATSASPRRGS